MRTDVSSMQFHGRDFHMQCLNFMTGFSYS